MTDPSIHGEIDPVEFKANRSTADAALPDAPNVFSIDWGAGFIQCWLPGAFGNRVSIEGVSRFKVEEDRWDDIEGIYRRIIIKATVLAEDGLTTETATAVATDL